MIAQVRIDGSNRKEKLKSKMNTTTNKELRRTGENERKIDELTKRWWNNGGRGRFASDSWPVGRRASAPNDRTQR